MESSQPSVLKHEWEHIREQVKEWWTDLTDADLRMSLSTVRQVGRHRWTFPSSTMKLTRSTARGPPKFFVKASVRSSSALSSGSTPFPRPSHPRSGLDSLPPRPEEVNS
jgi:hypothetical protein